MRSCEWKPKHTVDYGLTLDDLPSGRCSKAIVGGLLVGVKGQQPFPKHARLSITSQGRIHQSIGAATGLGPVSGWK
jgi:hypothetical protein